MGTQNFASHSGGNIHGTAAGASYVTLGSQNCSKLYLSNISGTSVLFQQDGTTSMLCAVPTGAFFPIEGITNTNQISIKMSNDGTAVVYGRWII